MMVLYIIHIITQTCNSEEALGCNVSPLEQLKSQSCLKFSTFASALYSVSFVSNFDCCSVSIFSNEVQILFLFLISFLPSPFEFQSSAFQTFPHVT